MSDDPNVRAAIAHWAPRFIANGIDYNDFVATTARVAHWRDWSVEWSRTAAQARSPGARGGSGRQPDLGGGSLCARFALPPFRKVRLLRRHGAVSPRRRRDGRGLPKGDCKPGPAGGADRHSLCRDRSSGLSAQAGGGRAPAGRADRLRPGFGQGGDERLRAGVPPARNGDAHLRRAGAGGVRGIADRAALRGGGRRRARLA